MGWRDIEGPDFSDLDWSEKARNSSVSTMGARAATYSRETERWYAKKRRSKRRWGRRLRVAAIMLGSIAAIVPLLSEIYSNGSEVTIAPGWATVALVLAATLVALDHYFGFSAAWMRFMRAELELARLRHAFEYEWQASSVAADPISNDELAGLFEKAADFVRTVDETVGRETEAWIQEFKSSLDDAGGKQRHGR